MRGEGFACRDWAHGDRPRGPPLLEAPRHLRPPAPLPHVRSLVIHSLIAARRSFCFLTRAAITQRRAVRLARLAEANAAARVARRDVRVGQAAIRGLRGHRRPAAARRRAHVPPIAALRSGRRTQRRPKGAPRAPTPPPGIRALTSNPACSPRRSHPGIDRSCTVGCSSSSCA